MLPPKTLLALVKSGSRQAAAEKFALIFSLGMYALYILLFSAIWRHTPFGPGVPGQDINYASMVWYIGVTELITLSSIQYREQVRADILNQQLSGLMGRPLAYWALKIPQLLGRGLVHTGLLAMGGVALCWLLTGSPPYLAHSWPLLLPPILLGVLLTLLCCFALGLLDVWGQYARPAYWVWQKALFVLGGLMLPLTLYPEWLQKIAYATPFPAMISLPASLMLQHDAAGLGGILLNQLFWIAILAILIARLHAAVRRHIGGAGD